MASRLSVPSSFGHSPSDADRSSSDNLKRNAWLALFSGSFLFWLMVVAMVWNLWN